MNNKRTKYLLAGVLMAVAGCSSGSAVGTTDAGAHEDLVTPRDAARATTEASVEDAGAPADVQTTANATEDATDDDAETAAESPRDGWRSVRVAYDRHERVARWNGRRIELSDDGGRSFRDVLAGRGAVSQVNVTRDGTVLAVRGDARRAELGTMDERDRVTWSRLPVACAHNVIDAADGALVWLCDHGESGAGESRIGVSRDGGRSWLLRAPPEEGNAYNDLAVGADGTLWFQADYECSCGGGHQVTSRGHVDGRAWTPVELPPDTLSGAWAVGAGVIYSAGDCGPGHRAGLCANDGARDWMVGRLGDPEQRWNVTMTAQAGVVIAVDTRLVRLHEDRVEVLAAEVPQGFVATSVDVDGRVYGLANDRVVRWTAERGFDFIE